MEQSILKSTKKILNVGEDDPSFDLDIITHINTAFSYLRQLGVGPLIGFQIEDDAATWEDFMGLEADISMTSAVKTNVYIRVRGLFDPPTTPPLINALEKAQQESDWRINVQREETEWTDPDPPDVLVVDGGDPSGDV